MFNDFDRDFAKRNANFDRDFNDMRKVHKTAIVGGGIMALISAIVSLGILAAVIYVAYHFISKVW